MTDERLTAAEHKAVQLAITSDLTAQVQVAQAELRDKDNIISTYQEYEKVLIDRANDFAAQIRERDAELARLREQVEALRGVLEAYQKFNRMHSDQEADLHEMARAALDAAAGAEKENKHG